MKFKVGDKVMIRIEHINNPHWIGPYTVLEFQEPVYLTDCGSVCPAGKYGTRAVPEEVYKLFLSRPDLMEYLETNPLSYEPDWE